MKAMSVQGPPQSCWVLLSLRTVRGTKLKARFWGGRGRNGHGTPGVAPPALGGGKGLSWPSGDTSPFSHLGSKGVGLTHVQLSVHQHTRGLFCQSASQLVFSPRCRTLHLLNFWRFLSATCPAAEVRLDGSESLWWRGCSQFCVVFEFAEGAP